jgi:argininosuccinate lyase
MTKLWGGRFTEKPDTAAWDLNSSLLVDKRMAIQDVEGNLAWAKALHKANILFDDEYTSINHGLSEIKDEFITGQFIFVPYDEDIHTAVERRLTELIGPTAGKLHTGRSRNDQVATDFRLWALDAIPVLATALLKLQSALLRQAELAGDTLMPGYTHLQRAQPILLAHWWLSHYWPLQRDQDRLHDLTTRVSVLPLGSGALAGTSFPIDRTALAVSLGFTEVSPNSLDAVSDRDFAAEFLFCASMIGIHLSKMAEQIIIFSSSEFGFFELSDAFTTGSSLMPQKKNPDIFELTRGKASSLLGLLCGLMATLKGLPSAYDKDLQEDKAPVFTAVDTLLAILPAITGALLAITTNAKRMCDAIDSFMMATDLADYLVNKGIPFRETHTIAGNVVRAAIEKKIGLHELPLEIYQDINSAFGEDVFQIFDPIRSIEKRSAIGGTSYLSVKNQIKQIKEELKT